MKIKFAERDRVLGLACVLVVIAACIGLTPVEGPPTPALPTISRVTVTPLKSSQRTSRVIDEPTKVRAILSSGAFSENGWVLAGARRIAPLYRIDLAGDDGVALVYWLGANSHPPRFPCYALCTGWWLASSGPAGNLDVTRYRPLPDSVYLTLLRQLDLP